MTNEKPRWTLIGEVFVSDEKPNLEEFFLWDNGKDWTINMCEDKGLLADIQKDFENGTLKKIVAQTTNSNLPGIPYVELPPVMYSEEQMLHFAHYLRNGLTNLEYCKKEHNEHLADFNKQFQPEIVVEPVMVQTRIYTEPTHQVELYTKDEKVFVRVNLVNTKEG